MKLIPEWRSAWSFLSVQLAAVLGLLDLAYEYLPAIQTYFPEGWVKWFALVIIAGRLINQRESKNADT